MLVEEILRRDVKNPMTIDRSKMIGRGWQMIALAHDNHPGSVIKANRATEPLSSPPENDPVVRFAELAMKHAPSNPYFPRIYKAMLLDSEKGTQLVVVMEKLHGVDSAKLRDVFQFHKDKMGLGDFISTQGSSSKEDLINVRALQQAFINPSTRKKILEKATDEKFKEAVQLLEPFIDSHSYVFDFHFGNIMLRLTPHGPQPVLIDPFGPISEKKK